VRRYKNKGRREKREKAIFAGGKRQVEQRRNNPQYGGEIPFAEFDTEGGTSQE